MGNSSSKDERKRPSNLRHGNGQQVDSGEPSPSHHTSGSRLADRVYGRNGSARESRQNLSFLHLGGRGEREQEPSASERPRETRQEREARSAERERQARLRERERSMREEHVDGGYLVTVGVYTGPEDFNKQVVRQLQIERRLAPFWQGLDDHKESWTEAQLVAAAKKQPIPEADAVPPDVLHTASQPSNDAQSNDANLNGLTVPITGRSQSYQSDRSASLSPSSAAFLSSSGPASPTSPPSSNNPLFRGRAKTLASALTGKSESPDLSPQEIRLPDEPYVNGQLLLAWLYKDAAECPICFMFYPPFLNKTRCCDQSICSECFVQIKRPDPHPPEHEHSGQQRPPDEEAEVLVSEVAACPFCVTPEFGVTYQPPPFRRGLSYAYQQGSLRNGNSAMSSSTSLQNGGGRRRAGSLSANDPRVVTTDRVRPDWAKKLADARAQALRRSAAATALHNAAYVLGNQGDGQLRSAGLLGRRRRTVLLDSPNASGSGTPREGEGSSDLVSGRTSSRRHRVEDLEDLMMMEAIRLSLAAEEERKRKEEKEANKEAKKKAKADKKEEKKAEKLAKRQGSSSGVSSSLYRAGTNDSTSTWASTSTVRSTSVVGVRQQSIMGEGQGKGKQPAQDFAGFNPLNEPTSTLNRDSPSPPATSSGVGNAQKHLEESRANLQPNAPSPLATPSPRGLHLRQLSNASSANSSFAETPTPGSQRADSSSSVLLASPSGADVAAGAQQQQQQHDGSNVSSALGTPAATNVEPMFNFRSLAAMIGEEDKQQHGNEHIEHAPETKAEEEVREPSPTGSPRLSPSLNVVDGRSRGDSGESSSSSAPPPIYVEGHSDDQIHPAPQPQLLHDPDSKTIGNVDVSDHGHGHGHGPGQQEHPDWTAR
ncbi:hypothetical protein DOTSEDRAFT_73692 [Lecanosticta acicola]|uniref:Protein SIP5 n=1 Tax=Lecanosticta acicola TaxID=111012 RepID=A0AAI8Z5D7_9PEZI|nr:hypothetical protein DOTSEDRAFT_73692 [Lecanosticta acicola]